jgi:hypothetical protein
MECAYMSMEKYREELRAGMEYALWFKYEMSFTGLCVEC